MLQAPMFECLSLDPFSSFDDGGSPAEVGIGGRDVVEALVVALVVVMLDEGLDLPFDPSIGNNRFVPLLVIPYGADAAR